MKLIYLCFLLAINGAHLAAATSSNAQLENKCAAYAFKAVKPLLEHLKQMKNVIEQHENKSVSNENEIKILRDKEVALLYLTISKDKEIRELQEKLAQSENKDAINAAIIRELRGQVELMNQKKTIEQKEKRITEYEIQFKESADKLKKCEELEAKNRLKSSSCIPYGNDPGIHEIKVSTLPPFDVLCDSQTAGPGWTVIQQRINGKEDFYRNWNTYREGFGSFDGDFFLGLERIHQLTSSQQHKLYIHMEQFDGKVAYKLYENFKVGPADDNYRLLSMYEVAGNGVGDHMLSHINQQFSTFDRDNDASGKNCAKKFHSGWWCDGDANYYCNLNGKYSQSKVEDAEGVFWDGFASLKTVKMLIRPKTD